MTEKETEFFMHKAYTDIFKHIYHTEGNSQYFTSKLPDGWDILDDKIFIIIENKKLIKQKKEGRKQLFSYYDNLPNDIKEKYKFYLILGLGKTAKTFKIIIYDNKTETDLSLTDIYDSLTEPRTFDAKEIHNLNQYLHDNQIILTKSQKTIFIAAILICLKIDKNLLKDYDEKTNPFIIADKMIEMINENYSDNVFTKSFDFIKTSLNNKYLYHIFNMLKVDVMEYGKDILNQFYSEFCFWDKNNDASLGIVLTPSDIVNMMVDKSFEYYKQFNTNNNIKIIDFCTGTGSFLVKASDYTDNLYGCEIGDERYTLAKCNFILHNLDFKNVIRNSCFDVKYIENDFDISIINPPFGKGIEREFVLFQIKLLKENGIGCCIIPRSNFNNNIDSINDFKKTILSKCQILEVINCNSKVFVPNASVECTIIIYCKNKKESNNVKVIDYSDDGYKIKKCIRCYVHEPKINVQTRKLSFDDDWNYQKEFDSMINEQEIIKLIYEYNNNYQYAYNKYMINKKSYNDIINTKSIEYKPIKEWKEYQIKDLMNLLPIKNAGNKGNTNDGEYLLISTGQQNQGLLKYVDKYEYDGTTHKYITVAMTGSSGSSFYQPFKFLTSDRVRVLEIKEDVNINPHLIALVMNKTLSESYSYSNGLSVIKLMDERIFIPIFEE